MMVRCSEYESECVMPAAIFADRWRCAWAVVGEAVRIKPSFDLGSVSRLVHDNAELRAEVERMRAVVEAARALVSWDWLWALPDGRLEMTHAPTLATSRPRSPRSTPRRRRNEAVALM